MSKETQQLTAELSAALTEAAFKADRLAAFGEVDYTHRLRLQRMAEVLRAEVNCLNRLTRPKVISQLVAAAVVAASLMFVVAPLRAQDAERVSSGGRVSEITTDSVPPDGTPRAMTVCSSRDSLGYPLTYLNSALSGASLVEIRAHERTHRLQLTWLADSLNTSCFGAMQFIHSSPARQAENEIQASCAGYDAAGLPPGSQRPVLQRIFQYFAREGVPLEVLAHDDMKYCTQEPWGPAADQHVASSGGITQDVPPPPKASWHPNHHHS